MWTWILGVISLSKQRHLELTEKTPFPGAAERKHRMEVSWIMLSNREFCWVDLNSQVWLCPSYPATLRPSACFVLLWSQTSLHLNHFNSSAQSGEKWAETGKCMFSDLCFLQVSFVIQDGWPLHLGDRLRILGEVVMGYFFFLLCIHWGVRKRDKCLRFLSKKLTWVFGNIFKICHTQNNIFSWYINVS